MTPSATLSAGEVAEWPFARGNGERAWGDESAEEREIPGGLHILKMLREGKITAAEAEAMLLHSR
ncbi:MAG: hypothetical protein C3F08_01195 [Candidatus Methylomirabilota bacterium]|nr:MAG: hypothetical protein C3F08_01195 [candidate division NC10 bacterium]